MNPPAPSQFGDFWFSFLSILLEGMPFILLGSLVSGFIDAFLPANVMERMLPRRAGPAILLSGLLGIVFPVCECAIVPVIRRLVQKGLPVGCAMTYMLAAPIVNPIVGLSTWVAFNPPGARDWWERPVPIDPAVMTGMRLMLGYFIAVAAGLVLSRVAASSLLRSKVLAGIRGPGGGARTTDATPRAPGQGIVQALNAAQRDFIETLLYFVIGVGIAALMQTQVLHRPNLQEGIRSMADNHWLAAPVLMLMAFVLSLCSTTDAFIIAADAIFPAVAKLAFLVFGPMLDLKLIFLYSTVLKPRVVLMLGIGLFIAVYLATFALGPVFAVHPKPG